MMYTKNMPVPVNTDHYPSAKRGATERLYYVTVLSNLIRGYDKYARVYDKSEIAESTFPNRFFLLSRHEIEIGIRKASSLLRKTWLPGDRLIVLQTHAYADELCPNLTTGSGRFVERSQIVLEAVHFLDDCGSLIDVRIEEACALSLRLHARDNQTYERLAPRSVSLLPIAKACQARCPFCFSKASVSVDTQSQPIDWRRVRETLERGRTRGAERVVITGGGEPALLKESDLDRMIREGSAIFSKVALISNGFKWGSMTLQSRVAALKGLDEAGLSVLAVSRHHFAPAQNAALMRLTTHSEEIAKTYLTIRSNLRQLKLRWICVLQRGGIENRESIKGYLDWAVESEVEEICFKELYVSTGTESEYHDHAANDWSARNQVSLRLVVELARDVGWEIVERLPWGAPIFEGLWRGKGVRVAAYTEPSLFWELKNGICRSWNLMSDGRCLASLEDRRSEVLVSGLRELPTISQRTT
jgi:molybdenum cofactor biosynthesis enzyme MoaA